MDERWSDHKSFRISGCHYDRWRCSPSWSALQQQVRPRVSYQNTGVRSTLLQGVAQTGSNYTMIWNNIKKHKTNHFYLFCAKVRGQELIYLILKWKKYSFYLGVDGKFFLGTWLIIMFIIFFFFVCFVCVCVVFEEN